jgi:hypothetical protein
LIFGVGLGPVGVSTLAAAFDGCGAVGSSLSLIIVTAGILGAVAFAFGRNYIVDEVGVE